MSSRLIPPADGCVVTARCLLAVLLLSFCIREARADIQNVRPRNQPRDVQFRESPPNAVEQSVQVNAGGQIEITLEAHGQEGKILTFLPRNPPAHGKLVGWHSLTRNTASVIYMHNPGDENGSDSFTFSVQARESLVSAPAVVDIAIIAPPARLVASPGDLDFGTVNVGEISRARITIENQGGGVVTGQLQPPPPWEVEGSADYRLAKNQKQTFQLIFRPGEDRVFEDDIRLGRESDQRVRLIGTGIKVFSAAELARQAAKVPEPVAPVQYIGETPPVPKVQSTPKPAVGLTPFSVASAPVEAGKAASSNRLNSAPTMGDSTLAAVNDAKVEIVRRRWNDSHNIKIAWETPMPPPKTYRIELRYLSLDSDQDLNVDWRPYAKVDIRAGAKETEATLRGLPSGTRQSVRVVAIDYAGRAAAPSGYIQVELPPGFYWGPTPFRVILVGLLICLGLIWRKRRNEKALIEEIEAMPIPSMRG